MLRATKIIRSIRIGHTISGTAAPAFYDPKSPMSKTILVTGAAGFIGSHAAQAFLGRGDTVVGLDNLNDYYDPNRKRANLAEVRCSTSPDAEFQFFEGDIRDTALLKQIFSLHPFDVVVHLAAMAGVGVSVQNPHLYFDVNLTGTLNLLDAAREHGVGNFVFASTSSVYGGTTKVPFVESDPCDLPLAPYPASKRAAEMLGYTYHHLYGLNFTATRFFTVYGPRGRVDMMAYKVAENIFHGNKVPIYCNGQMHRDWTYVADIVSGLLAAADRPLGFEIINLGRGEPVLLSDFVRMIEELAGKKAHLVPEPMPATDIPYTFSEISKARRLLGYDPKVSVREGIEQFWKWYRRDVLKSVP